MRAKTCGASGESANAKDSYAQLAQHGPATESTTATEKFKLRKRNCEFGCLLWCSFRHVVTYPLYALLHIQLWQCLLNCVNKQNRILLLYC
jgi:hypothetical protein